MTLKPVVVLEGRGVVGLDIGELDLAGAQGRDGRGRVLEVAVDHAGRPSACRRDSPHRPPTRHTGRSRSCLNLNGPVPIGVGRPPGAGRQLLRRHAGKRMLRQDHELGQCREETRIRARELDNGRPLVRRLDRCDGAEARGEDGSGLAVLGKVDRELYVLGGEGLAVVPGLVGELEGVLGLVGADGILVGEGAFDRCQIGIVIDQRLEVDVEPSEPACGCQRIELPWKPPGPTSKPPVIVFGSWAAADVGQGCRRRVTPRRRWLVSKSSAASVPPVRLSGSLVCCSAMTSRMPLIMFVEPLPRSFDVARRDGLDDFVMIPPGRERVRVGEIGEVGRLVERQPEHLDQAGEHAVVLAAEQQSVELLVFLGEALVALGALAHAFRHLTQSRRGPPRRSSRPSCAISPVSRTRRISRSSSTSRRPIAEAIGEIVEERLERELLDEHADAAAGLQDADGFERLDRLADRVAADAELLGEKGSRAAGGPRP